VWREAELAELTAPRGGGPATVRHANERLAHAGRRWAYTTVLTLLQRLQAKGWAVSEATGPAHVYRAAGTREDWLRVQLQGLADQTCSGDAVPLVLTLVEGGRFTREELAHFRRLIDRLEAEAEAEASRGRGKRTGSGAGA
jgi:predicted transcriptional regulator